MMGWYSKETCNKCGVKVEITEGSMGVPGGLEKEPAFCPQCQNLLTELMTDGYLAVNIVSENDKQK